MTPIVCIIGYSDSGKTFVLSKIAAELKRRGYRVATVKHAPHGFDLDRQGKDSWHHTRSGSDAVAISSPDQFALMQRMEHDASLGEIARTIGPGFDIIIAEGFKRSRALKIQVIGEGEDTSSLCLPEELLAVACDHQMSLDAPLFRRDDADGLVNLLEQKLLGRDSHPGVALFVNGEPVPMTKFVQSIFTNTLLGMVSSLKGIPLNPGSVDLSIRRHSQYDQSEITSVEKILPTAEKDHPVRLVGQ